MSFQYEDRPERSQRPTAAQKKQNPFANTRLANEVVRSIDAAAPRRPSRCFTGETASGRLVTMYSPRKPLRDGEHRKVPV